MILYLTTLATLAIEGVIEQVTGEDAGAFGDLPDKTAAVGNSSLSLILLIGAFAVAAGLAIAGIFISIGNRETRSEGKNRIPNILMGAAIIFGSISLVGLLASFAPKIFG